MLKTTKNKGREKDILEVTKHEFYRRIYNGNLDVHPVAQGYDYPYINLFKFRNGDVWGQERPVIGKNGRVLIACEESQVVTKEMRASGIEAYSCDIKPCSGGHPEWHIQNDVTSLLEHEWRMIVAFPPCTHLAVSGAKWFEQKRKDGRQKQGIDFFMLFANAKCKLIAIENPVGIMSSIWRKPDQIIQPFEYGEPYSKKTCLWLKGLPLLVPTNIVDRGERIKYASGRSLPKWYANLSPKERSVLRSKTFIGIAKAMASQWGVLVK